MNILEKPLILGVYDDGDKLLHTVQKLRKKGVEIFDCFTSLPGSQLRCGDGNQQIQLNRGCFPLWSHRFLKWFVVAVLHDDESSRNLQKLANDYWWKANDVQDAS
jgi:hypothetical protein